MNNDLLKQQLVEWQDFDGAMFGLGVALGIWPDDWVAHGLGNKWIFWSDNPLGNALYGCLEKLVEVGILLEDDEGCKFKWNPDFSIAIYDEKQNGEWRRQQTDKKS